MSRSRRLPDHTPASALIRRGRDAQAVHAMVHLTRRAMSAAAGLLDDTGRLHQCAHTIDGSRRTREWREWMADRVEAFEAAVLLLERQ